MNLENLKKDLIFSRELPKTLCWWAGLGAIIVIAITLIWHAPSVMNAWAHALEAQAKQSENVTDKLVSVSTRFDNIAAKVENKIDPILDNLDAGSLSVKNSAGSIENKVPLILNNLNSVGSSGTKLLDEGTGLIGDVRRDTLPAVNAILLKLGNTVEITNKQLPEVVDELRKTGEGVRIILDQPSLKGPNSIFDSLNKTAQSMEPIPNDLHNIGLNFTRISDSMAYTSEDVKDYVHKTLNPPPCKGFGCFVKKWVITPIRASSGLIYLYLRATM